VAATSHLPYLIANALAYITPDQAQPLVGPGLRSTTRLAATPLSMMRDVLITNQANLIEELQRFGDHLELLRNCLEQGEWGRLEEILMKGASHYDEYIRNWLVSREGQDNSYE
jgi:prephenate dehydrogenase